MEHNPSAPPPSYDDVMGNTSQQNYKNPIGFQVHESQQNQSNFNAPVPMVPQPPCTQPINNQLQINPNLVQPPQLQYNQTNSNVVIIHGGPLELGHYPTRLICPICHQSTLTKVKYNSSCLTHSMALFCCFFGLFIFSCLPYFITMFKNSSHYCGKCGKYLGTHRFGT